MRLVAAFLMLLVVFPLTSCQYVKDRAVDVLDPYRGVIGVGSTVGVRGRVLGLVDSGLMMGAKPNAAAVGWKYGSGRWFSEKDTRVDVDQAEIIKTTSMFGLKYGDGSYFSARNSFALLPVLFTWVDATPTDYEWQVPEEGEDYDERTWLWESDSFRENHYAQIHSLDIELEAGLLLYLDLGFSPGEVLDFWLGLVLIDLAADDGRI